MSYQSKYTGEEIDELLDKVNAEGLGSVEELFNGNAQTKGSIYELSKSVEDYDFILFVGGHHASGSNDIYDKTSTLVHRSLVTQYKPWDAQFCCSVIHTSGSHFFIRFNIQDATHFKIISTECTNWIAPTISNVYGIKLGGGDSAPTGNIISFMGTKAPKGYLICDGAEYNIADYPKLASHFEEQFEDVGYFGGDGITTFKVPDLRNEFLRGYHGDAEKKLSGEIGIHQNPTQHAYIEASNIPDLNYPVEGVGAGYMDSTKISSKTTRGYTRNGGTYSANNGLATYTARPTNVAVLYCIKY